MSDASEAAGAEPRPGLRATLCDHWLLGLLAAGLLVRVVLAIWLDASLEPRGDEGTYLRQAGSFLETGRFETGVFVRPPLYFLFLAATEPLAGWLGISWSILTRLLQCFASTAIAIPIYRCARRVGGLRVARLAALFALFDPTLIAFSHLLWPETLFSLAVALVFDGVSDLDRGPLWRALPLGVLTGLAMLLKPVFGLFTLLLAGWWLSRLGLRRTLQLCFVFGGAAAVVISPWVIRNQLRYGPTIIMENQGPYNLWVGNSAESPEWILKQWYMLPDPVARARAASREGWNAIARDPALFAERFPRRILRLWGPEFFALRHAVLGGYGEVSVRGVLATFWILQAAWVLALLFAALGMQPASRDPTLRLVLTYMVVFTLMVACMVATTRFRVPFAFWISIAAAFGVERLRARELTRGALVAVALAAAVLAASFTRPLFWRLARGEIVTRVTLDQVEWRRY